MPHCESCRCSFNHDSAAEAFLGRVALRVAERLVQPPAPRLCPACRLQRRLCFRNQIYMYTRASAFSGRKIFSAYPEDAPGCFIGRDEWWSDSWDAETYGQPIDFSRPFFEQWQDLALRVPHMARSCLNEENCDYCHSVTGTKDCYLVFNTADARDCWYCENAVKSVDCIDCSHTTASELCYDCVGCAGCYGLQSSLFCSSCSDSFWLSHCRSCRNCFGCANLYRREYCVFNQQLTQSAYEQFIAQADLGSYASRKSWASKALEFFKAQPRPHIEAAFVDNVSGNFIFESKNVSESFVVRQGENLRWCYNTVAGVRDCQDLTAFGNGAELLYDCANCGSNAYHLLFCDLCYGGSSKLAYCRFCIGCTDCFGCVSLRRKQYAILNRVYDQAEYERLVLKLVEHMTRTGEWGEFLPARYSLFPYNHSYAHRLFPLERSEALARGMRWYERADVSDKDALPTGALLDRLPASGGTFTVLSEQSGRPFRITAEEIRRYARLNVPLPRQSYDERMEARAKWVDGYQLHRVRCAASGRELLSPINPADGWQVWDWEVFENEFFG